MKNTLALFAFLLALGSTSTAQARSDVVVEDSATCAECADTDNYEAYRAALIRECFDGFRPTSGGIPGIIYWSDEDMAITPGSPGLNPSPDHRDTCRTNLEYNARWLENDWVFVTVCGEAGPNPGEDCLTGAIRFEIEIIGFEAGLDIGVPDAGFQFGFPIGVKRAVVMIRDRFGNDHLSTVQTTDRGAFPGVLPDIPVHNGMHYHGPTLTFPDPPGWYVLHAHGECTRAQSIH